jgi:IMP dehydrogenase/GMP reductase
MKRSIINEALAFDDVLLVPQHSKIASRKHVDLSSDIGGIILGTPIIAAPMDTVTEAEMAIKMAKLGGLGVLHRYMPIEQQAKMFQDVVAAGATAFTSIGATGNFLEDARVLVKAGANSILVDTANGHSDYAISAVRSLKKEFGNDLHVMSGNIATADGYARLADAGTDSIRVGIGGGSVCTTRIVSGHGVPTLASIMDIRSVFPFGSGPAIVADGGIRNSGDASKALAAGASAVMLGGALAGTDESPGELIDGNSKIFRGMASKEAQQDGRGYVSGVEGIATTVPYKGSVEHIINDFRAGIASAMSYTGVDNLYNFVYNSMYIQITNSGLAESKPHGKA